MQRNDLAILTILPIPMVAVGCMFVLVFIIASQPSISLGSNEESAEHSQAVVPTRTLSSNVAALATIAAAPDRPGLVRFQRDIQPILATRCVYCHGPNSIAGSAPNGLLLDTYENVMLGSSFLPVVQPGQPGNSTLVLLLRSGAMPANAQPLSEEQIQLIETWIAQGARDN